MPKLNKVKERLIYLAPTVQAGWEDESNVTDFDVIKQLGQGAFGKVYRVCHKKSKLIYAIKEMNKSQLKYNNMVEQVVNEVKIMYGLNHDYIIKLYNHFEDDKNIYLIIEFASGGQLYQNLFRQPGKRFPEKICAKYIFELIESLEYIHGKGIIHRDIKPENILIDSNDNIKLADFGWSNYLKPDETRSTFCGTLDYLAPEMLENSRNYDAGVDVWSVGVLTIELLTGVSPFSPADTTNKKPHEIEAETKINIKNVKFTFPKDFPQLAKDFVSKILLKNSVQRIKLAQMKEHPWIVENCSLAEKPKSKIEELKGYKDISHVKINEEEMSEAIPKKNYEPFSVDEILKCTRPQSIINKEFDESNKNLPNYLKPGDIQLFDNLSSVSPDNKYSQIIANLNAKITELKDRNNELEAKSNKSGNIDNSKKLEDEIYNLTKKLKTSEDSYNKQKLELDETWTQLIQKQKIVKDLENDKKVLEEANKESEKKRKKMKEQLAEASKKIEILQAENDELKGKLGGKGDEKKGELLDQFDDYLEKLKQKHKQELEELTKK